MQVNPRDMLSTLSEAGPGDATFLLATWIALEHVYGELVKDSIFDLHSDKPSGQPSWSLSLSKVKERHVYSRPPTPSSSPPVKRVPRQWMVELAIGRGLK